MIQASACLQSPSLEFCLGTVLFSQEKGQVLGSWFVFSGAAEVGLIQLGCAGEGSVTAKVVVGAGFGAFVGLVVVFFNFI